MTYKEIYEKYLIYRALTGYRAGIRDCYKNASNNKYSAFFDCELKRDDLIDEYKLTDFSMLKIVNHNAYIFTAGFTGFRIDDVEVFFYFTPRHLYSIELHTDNKEVTTHY